MVENHVTNLIQIIYNTPLCMQHIHAAESNNCLYLMFACVGSKKEDSEVVRVIPVFYIKFSVFLRTRACSGEFLVICVPCFQHYDYCAGCLTAIFVSSGGIVICCKI